MEMRIYPVVHIKEPNEAAEQAGIALETGADGVFLLDPESHNFDNLVQTYNLLKLERPDSYVGINLLQTKGPVHDIDTVAKLWGGGELSTLPTALWIDDVRGYVNNTAELEKAARIRADNPVGSMRLYGGTAFKYTQHYTDVPFEAAEQAHENSQFVDIVTTSGAKTGDSPEVRKVSAMAQLVGRDSLALASGVDVANIESYRPHVGHILVASSVEIAPMSGIFDEQKLTDIIQIAHQS